MRRRRFCFGLHLNLGAKLRDENEIEPVCSKDFFWSSPEFGGKIPKYRTEIELFSLTKLRKTFRPLGICLIKKKSTPMFIFIIRVIIIKM